MGPDDKTTEIEIPSRRATDSARSNIVHVNFSAKAAKPKPSWSLPVSTGEQQRSSVSVGKFQKRPVDRISPWMIRVIALVAVLLLSLLVL